MRTYLSAAALGAAFLAWLVSGLGREGASEARDAPAGLNLRRGVAEGERTAEAKADAEPETATVPRRAVRIVYPPPYEPR